MGWPGSTAIFGKQRGPLPQTPEVGKLSQAGSQGRRDGERENSWWQCLVLRLQTEWDLTHRQALFHPPGRSGNVGLE